MKPSRPAHPSHPGLRLGRGLVPPSDRIRDRWIWQHPDWPAFTWEAERLVEPLGRARQALGRLQMAGMILAPRTSREVLSEVLALEGVSSSAIEGERINPASMATSVARHLGLPVDPAAPIDRSAEGIAAVLWDALQNHPEPMTLDRLCRWHRALFPESRPDIAVGRLRPGTVTVETAVSETQRIVHLMAVPRDVLEPELERFLTWFNAGSGMDGLVRAGLTHLWFVTIHPFDDGNGRIGRALTDLAMAQDRASVPLARMSTRILQVRPDYYAALERAQAFGSGMDATPWLAWFLDQVAEACGQCEQVVRRTLAKGAFWARHLEDDINERQRKALNRLLEAGPGGFIGGMTTRKYASLNGCSLVTASRDLSSLSAMGCLVASGGGRSRSYAIAWTEFLA